MSVDVKSVQHLLSTITDAFTAAKDAFQDTDHDNIFESSQDGISLLDVKNDLLLSYLQHLVFLIVLKLDNKDTNLGKDVVKKLIELRAYLDRGVKPLESRLRYQIDKALAAANDAERSATQKSQRVKEDDSDVSGSGSEDEGSVGSDRDAQAGPGKFRQIATKQDNKKRSTDGIYRPPRQNPTAMPTLSRKEDVEDNKVARRRKHALLNEFINEEHSGMPTAQPSIGSNNTILDRGRQHSSLNSRDRDRERERKAYEESNFVRLPGVSKAEKKKDKARQARESRDMFGGEDWTGLGGLGDRVNQSVSGKGRGSLLDRREKRKRDTIDSPRGDGVGIGETFEKRKKVVQGRMERKKGKG